MGESKNEKIKVVEYVLSDEEIRAIMKIAELFPEDVKTVLPANIPYNQALYLIEQNPVIFKALYLNRRSIVKGVCEKLKKETTYSATRLLEFEDNIGQLSYALAKKYEYETPKVSDATTISQTDMMRDSLERELNIYPDNAFVMMLSIAGTSDPSSISFLESVSFSTTEIWHFYCLLTKLKGNSHTYKSSEQK